MTWSYSRKKAHFSETHKKLWLAISFRMSASRSGALLRHRQTKLAKLLSMRTVTRLWSILVQWLPIRCYLTLYQLQSLLSKSIRSCSALSNSRLPLLMSSRKHCRRMAKVTTTYQWIHTRSQVGGGLPLQKQQPIKHYQLPRVRNDLTIT